MYTVNLGDGYINLESEEARDFLETLIENGTFWEYISKIFNESLENKTQKEMEKVTTMLTELMQKMNSMEKGVTYVSNKVDTFKTTPVVQSTSNNPSSVTNEANIEAMKAKRKALEEDKKKRQAKTQQALKKGGGLAMMANKLGRLKDK